MYLPYFGNNRILLNVIVTVSVLYTSFNTDSFPMIIISRASSISTLHKSIFISSSYKPLVGVIISGIASRLKALGIESILLKIKDH